MVTRKKKHVKKLYKYTKKYKNNKDKKKRKTRRRYFRRGGQRNIVLFGELRNFFVQYLRVLTGEAEGEYYNSINLNQMCIDYVNNDTEE
jgi:hypothetical protein